MFGEDESQEEIQNKVNLAIEDHRNVNDTRVMKALNFLLRKPKNTLNLEEMRFLQARSSYMTDSQRKDYKDILAMDLSHGSQAEKTAQEGGQLGGDESEQEVVVPEPTRKELDEKARELGIENPEKLPSKQAVQDAIKAVEDAE